ncbi:CU044_5270 family protein [Streptomyces sp. NBC_01320]|uniref:CU044_5270 family protein n=1 Tax=Streptomyces sp. NBC_01320 TaxID=2903824 RepID=UPI002E12F65C|nr:CU044_5270 family protein [Streptomyces sp. NBC_01320]
MDEMTQLRELRADAPVPDRAALAPGRQRLTDSLAGGRRTRRLRADWRIASIGAAAAITAAALLTTQIGADGPTHGATAAAPLTLDSPAEVLNRAADELAKQQAAPEPRDDQWIYTRTKIVQREPEGGSAAVGGFLYRSGSAAVGRFSYDPDSWVPYDNSAAAKNGKDSDYRTARQVYRAADELPDDPARLLAKVRSFYPTGHTAESPPEAEAQHSFRAMGLMVETYPIAPDALARIYRALATVPGVKVTDHLVKDAAGRDAIAITRKEDGSHEQREILINPRDYSYAGMRFVAAEDYEMKAPAGMKVPTEKYKAGEVLTSEARIRAAVVDAEGQKS